MPVLCNAAISNAADVGRNEIDDLAPDQPASLLGTVFHTLAHRPSNSKARTSIIGLLKGKKGPLWALRKRLQIVNEN
jgi:hypothetical protein